MKILLIKLKNLGDTLLLTPVISGIKQRYPHSHVTALVRSGTESMLAGCPDVDEVLVSAAPEKNRRKKNGLLQALNTVLQIRKRSFDWVFELTDGSRGRWFTCLSRSTNRVTSEHGRPIPWYFKIGFTHLSSMNWHLMHRVEKDYRIVSEFLKLSDEVPPLVFHAPEGRDLLVSEQRPYVIMHPVSRWKRKAWPAERWLTVGRALIERGYICVLSSGPDAEEASLTEELGRMLGPNAVVTHGQRTWPEMARLLRGASLYVGLDTAAMHLAAASQCSIVALFGPSIEHHWHPWRSHYEIVSPGGLLHWNYPEFIYDAEKRSMQDIQITDVLAACDRMLAEKEGVS